MDSNPRLGLDRLMQVEDALRVERSRREKAEYDLRVIATTRSDAEAKLVTLQTDFAQLSAKYRAKVRPRPSSAKPHMCGRSSVSFPAEADLKAKLLQEVSELEARKAVLQGVVTSTQLSLQSKEDLIEFYDGKLQAAYADAKHWKAVAQESAQRLRATTSALRREFTLWKKQVNDDLAAQRKELKGLRGYVRELRR